MHAEMHGALRFAVQHLAVGVVRAAHVALLQGLAELLLEGPLRGRHLRGVAGVVQDIGGDGVGGSRQKLAAVVEGLEAE